MGHLIAAHVIREGAHAGAAGGEVAPPGVGVADVGKLLGLVRVEAAAEPSRPVVEGGNARGEDEPGQRRVVPALQARVVLGPARIDPLALRLAVRDADVVVLVPEERVEVFGRRAGLALRPFGVRFEAALAWDILKVGAVACLSPFLTVGTVLALTALAGRYGEATLAGYGLRFLGAHQTDWGFDAFDLEWDLLIQPVSGPPIWVLRFQEGFDLRPFSGHLDDHGFFVEPLAQGVLRTHALDLDAPAEQVRRGPIDFLILDYLAGRRMRLGWPLDLRLASSPFQRVVLRLWEAAFKMQAVNAFAAWSSPAKLTPDSRTRPATGYFQMAVETC